jgi:ribonuclease D
MSSRTQPNPPTPDRETIALLPDFERLGLDHIYVVADANAAFAARVELFAATVLGFDTESKPTFKVGEVSTGPHVVQLATRTHAWVLVLHDETVRELAAEVLVAPHIVKAGFGLNDDKKFITRKLGIELHGVLDLTERFRTRGHRKDIGVKTAIAMLFGQRFIKSKKAATSNWANPRLTPAQIVYAANDAYAAIRVYEAMEQMDAAGGEGGAAHGARGAS